MLGVGLGLRVVADVVLLDLLGRVLAGAFPAVEAAGALVVARLLRWLPSLFSVVADLGLLLAFGVAGAGFSLVVVSAESWCCTIVCRAPSSMCSVS